MLFQQPVHNYGLTIPGVDQVLIRGSYDCQPLQQLIRQLKYHYWWAITSTLQGVTAPLASLLPSLTDAVIIPVPLHTRRLRERGFNQSKLIAAALAAELNLPVRPLLHRIRHTPPQAQLSAAARQSNVADAFCINPKLAIPPSVILVDDVITTGSTIEACAKLLCQNGVTSITAVALAKG